MEILGSMLVLTPTPMGRILGERPSFWEPGGGRLRHVRGSARYAAV